MRGIRSYIVIAAVTALVFAGCSGGSGTNGGTTTQPTFDSPKTIATMMAGASYGQALAMQVMLTNPQFTTTQAALKALSKYTYDTPMGTTDCTWQADGFECTITSSEGGTCTTKGTWDFTGTGVMTSDYTFDDYTIAGTTINGGYTVELYIDWGGFGTNVSASAGKMVSPIKQTSSACEISDDDTEFDDQNQNCTWDTSDQQSCDSQFAFFRANMTVGDEGYSITSVCGSFNFAAGTTMDMALCQTNVFNMSYSVSGSFNGQDVDGNMNVSCEMPTTS